MLLIIGFLFMVFIFAVVGILSGMAAVFIDLPSASLILVSLLFFLCVSKSGKILGRYIKTSFKKEHTYTGTELEALSAAVKNTIKFILATGGFGFMTGLIATLGYLGSPDKLGPNLAICLITLTYSITINAFVFLPVQAWAENKLNILKDMDAKNAQTV
jgi:flagellar motor component MotA